jgi:hypothetical protein
MRTRLRRQPHRPDASASVRHDKLVRRPSGLDPSSFAVVRLATAMSIPGLPSPRHSFTRADRSLNSTSKRSIPTSTTGRQYPRYKSSVQVVMSRRPQRTKPDREGQQRYDCCFARQSGHAQHRCLRNPICRDNVRSARFELLTNAKPQPKLVARAKLAPVPTDFSRLEPTTTRTEGGVCGFG